MHQLSHDHIFMSRRNLIFTIFLSPFLVNALIADTKTSVKGSSSANSEDEFVIVGGWVLLKHDLIGKLV